MIRLAIIIFIFSFNLFAQTTVRPWLGIGIEKGKNGVLIEKVIPNTPAQKANLQALDEIISIDSKNIKTAGELIEYVTSKGIGNTVELEVIRNGKMVYKKITLVARPDLLDVAKSALLNKEAPNFQATNLKDNKKYLLNKHKGKPLLIEFWATWCPACLGATEQLNDFAKKYQDKIEVLAISNESKKTLKKFIAKRLPYILKKKESFIYYLHSKKGKEDVSSKYYSNSIPMFILVDKKGNVIDLAVGAGQVLDKILEKAKSIM